MIARLLLCCLLAQVSLAVELPKPLPIGTPAIDGQGVSERSFKRLQSVYGLIEQQNFQGAETELASLIAQVDSQAYELSVALKTAAFVAFQQDKLGDAVVYFDAIVTMNALRKDELNEALKQSAQLSFALENYQESIDKMLKWSKAQKIKLVPEDWLLIAQAYQLLDNTGLAIEYYQRTVELALTQQSEINENWLQQLIALNYGENKLSKTVYWLEFTLQRFGKLTYFKQLAGVNQQLDKPKQALAAFEAAYHAGLMTEDKDIELLASSLLVQGYPLKAATLLQNHQLEVNQELLQQALLQAKEWQQALEVAQAQFKVAPNSELAEKIASLLVQLENWQGLLEFVANENEYLEQSKKLNLRGFALVNMQDFAQAEEVFMELVKLAPEHAEAKSWLRYLASLNPEF